tara:strand:- start:89 stop:277 length:189 start_codon:yes stop_codon:yes gene_type:complete
MYIIGVMVAQIVLERDEYLKIKKTIIQININSNETIGLIIVIIPIYVATPLPPLNFIQIGKI